MSRSPLTGSLDRWFASPSALLRQTPITVIFVVATIASIGMPTLVVTSVPGLVSGLLVIGVATALAALVSRRPQLSRYLSIIPALDFIAIGVLRFATGESRSIFVSLVVLPVVWFAVEAGRRYVVYAFLGVCVVLLLPFVLGGDEAILLREIIRSAFSAVSFGIAAAIINEVSKQARLRLETVREREREASSELSKAADVQQSLLPPPLDALSGWSIAGACVPSRAIGGDFFDWYRTDEGLAFTIGDVMGKGAGAGIIAATVRAVVRSARTEIDPTVALERASNMLATELGDAVVFATLFHARLRTDAAVLAYSDGGHGLGIIVRADGSWERLVSDGLPVGIALDGGWSTREVRLQTGDMVVVFSDGVLDLYDDALEAIEAIAALAADAPHPHALVDWVAGEARRQHLPDDVTIVAIRREQEIAGSVPSDHAHAAGTR
ncbi:regulator [Labedella phragmitis]|uniref:Regulator n=1 Tax=Labedella phragmitis TaxID=2498849 RepID=A0A444PZA1_9MICO|nr:SpoIIE family protein phosphatase [Labedella phragmitis]RWZ53133.1 regulator [Labedella phragmitis]